MWARVTLALGCCLLLTSSRTTAVPSAATSDAFVDETAARKLTFRHISPHTSRKYLIETMGSGVALFDYDNDGRLDIFCANGVALADPTAAGTVPAKTDPKSWNRLFHQKPDGTFEDVTEHAGLQGVGFAMGVAVGDFDNDGFADLYVTAYGGNRLYRNKGDGTFEDITASAGVAGSGWSTSAAWVDLDNDGLLDLVVLRYLQWDFDDIWCGDHKEGYRAYCHPDTFKPIAPLAFHNDGHGKFTEVAAKIGLGVPAKGLGIALADYDRDGHIDLVVANDSTPEFLFHNKGSGTFEEKGLVTQMAVDEDGKTFAGMGVTFGDYNNDGLPDLIIDNLANQMYAVYQNTGNGDFNYTTKSTGIGRITMLHSGWGIQLFDYDNDGWKDLLVAQGHDLDTVELTSPHLRYREPLLLAHNQAGRTFEDVSAKSGAIFREPLAARGLAIGDIDNDGRLDAVVTTNDGPAYLLHNQTSDSNHWVTLQLVGKKSNRDGIGAEVKLTTAAGAQYATVSTAGSYLSSSDKRIHFGIGSATTIKSIEIHWPSGIVQSLANLKVDQVTTVEESGQTAK